jgi:hypothetical protein
MKTIKVNHYHPSSYPPDNFTGIAEYPDGEKIWYKDGKYHRTDADGPAIIWPDGSKEWYQNNKRHRINGPALEHPGGRKEWFKNGIRHRMDGPAVEYLSGDVEYWINREKTYKEAIEVLNKLFSKEELELL